MSRWNPLRCIIGVLGTVLVQVYSKAFGNELDGLSQCDYWFCFLFQELNNTCEPVVTQPKPKIESPKLERTPNGPNTDKKEDDLDEGKNSFGA